MNRTLKIATALVVGVASFAAGYGLSARNGGGEAERIERDTRDSGDPVLSALPSHASSGNSRMGIGLAVSEIARNGELGLFVKLRAYLRLVNSTPTGGLGDLLRKIEREVPEDLGGDVLAGIIGRRWAEEDPLAAYEALLAGDPQWLEGASEEVTQAAAAADPERAWNMVMGIEVLNRRQQMVSNILGAIGAADMQAALTKVAEMESPSAYRHAMEKFWKGAIAAEPEAALDAIGQLPEGAVVDDLYLRAFAGLASEDTGKAIARIGEIADLATRMEALRGVAHGWSPGDYEGALEWASSLPTSRERDETVAIVVEGVSDVNGARAAALLGSLNSPQLRKKGSRNVAVAWYQQDEEAALAWANEDLDGTARIQALDHLLQEHGAGMEFERQLMLAEAVPGDVRAKSRFVERWAGQDPAAAAAWVMETQSGSGNLMTQVYQEWIVADLPAAEAFLESVPSPEFRKKADELIVEMRKQLDETEAADDE